MELPASGNQQDQGISLQDSSDRSLLAREVVVPRSSTVVSGTTPSSPSKAGSSSATKGSSSVAQPVADSQSSRVELMQQSCRSQGFSKEVAERVVSSTRSATTALYQCRWAAFSKWCLSKDTSASKASRQLVADFLLYLFEVKKFQVSTIQGYLSSIVSTISLNPEIRFSASDECFVWLFKSFHIERPRTVSSTPKWDLSLVLHYLAGPPFEPSLEKASCEHFMQDLVSSAGVWQTLWTCLRS
jgi:hypothetical protein